MLSMAAQAIRDGELLALVPASAVQRYEPNIENVCTALARFAQPHFPSVSGRDAVALAAALTGMALPVAGVIVWWTRWVGGPTWAAPAVFGATAVVLVVAAALGARLRLGRVEIDGAAWLGPTAAASGRVGVARQRPTDGASVGRFGVDGDHPQRCRTRSGP
jgi:hypothetical protein